MRVMYLIPIEQHPQTGGDLFYLEAFDYLKAQPDVDLLLPEETDLQFLNRPENCLGINSYFFERFRRLPRNTIVVESECFFFDLFLANLLVKAFRHDIRFLISARQRPAPLLRGPKRVFTEGMALPFFRSADVVTVNSRYLGQELTARYGISPRKIHVVYSAGKKLGSLGSRANAKNNGRLQLLCVAHIRRLKGQRVLLEALSKLRTDSVELVLVGGTKDADYEDEIRELIGELDLWGCVRLVGRLEGEDLACAYARADIFVLPSLYEAYGVAVQEAMSFGLPVVASKGGGIPEQLTDGIEGFLVPPGDPIALADALHKLVVNPELRKRMGERGRQRVTELPTWDVVCDRFYQALLVAENRR